MLGLSQGAAYAVFFVLAAPVCAWVVWSDLARMKIPNAAVLALGGIWLVAGPLLVPLSLWAWGWAALAVVLAAGIALNALVHFGAGDAKFAAAAAPFILRDPASLRLLVLLLAAFTLSAFLTHRAVRRIGPLRALAPGWESWRRADFPMGVPLALGFAAYLLALALLS